MTCGTSGYVQRGNTVRLMATFRDWDDDPIDPDIVKVIIYDRKWQQLSDNELGPGNRIETGQYFYDHMPDQTGTFYVEWHGRISGQPSLYRDTLTVRDI
ncbi:hypothetical protein B1748_29190 [Paenibacillus sp. MY03]|uniref:hypothetical protein n=1 Tax=Paenibacillus sp. MY03 TaxID=302980 RepID=UPI000B3C70F6|nr:hypothetical protein [Paenibacillus sp. MY03]OUS70312.1 hypothetical protein B1748_29190 [Paenibacillus sp. MY03]